MKKKITIILLAVVFILLVATVPFNWFKIELGTSQQEVYAECSNPTHTDLRDIKGECWIRDAILWRWIMYVGFTNKLVTNASIWLDIGPNHSIRIFVSDDGEINIHK